MIPVNTRSAADVSSPQRDSLGDAVGDITSSRIPRGERDHEDQSQADDRYRAHIRQLATREVASHGCFPFRTGEMKICSHR